MNRGSSQRSAPSRRKRPRFNEAPIHESGKFMMAARFRGCRYRFNEAPIHESGK